MKTPPQVYLSQDRKLLLQSIALLIMLLAPVLLYLAAQAGAIAIIYLLLGVMATAMVLAMIIS